MLRPRPPTFECEGDSHVLRGSRDRHQVHRREERLSHLRLGSFAGIRMSGSPGSAEDRGSARHRTLIPMSTSTVAVRSDNTDATLLD
jgi:hypothetical protein